MQSRAVANQSANEPRSRPTKLFPKQKTTTPLASQSSREDEDEDDDDDEDEYKKEDEVERHLGGLCVDEVGWCAQSVGRFGEYKKK